MTGNTPRKIKHPYAVKRLDGSNHLWCKLGQNAQARGGEKKEQIDQAQAQPRAPAVTPYRRQKSPDKIE